MLKIKLVRFGKKNQPQYRLVVTEKRSKLTGRVTATLGHYNPLTKPSSLVLDYSAYQAWLAKGAQPTLTVRSLVNQYQKTANK